MPNLDQVRYFQSIQTESRDRMYRAESPALKEEAKSRYEHTVNALSELLGPNAPCWDVDCDLWNYFSDYYKDVYGVRPKHAWTVTEVKEWVSEEHEFVED